MSKAVTTAEAEYAVRTLLAYIGEDPEREGLRDTPARFLKAWTHEWGRGYQPASTNLCKLFGNENSSIDDQMIMVRDIAFYSHCEHHITPFFGTAAIAYIPTRSKQREIVGLSKLARIVDHFSRRLQVQERLTVQIAEFIGENISPDVGVVLSATHMCMVSRGAQQPNARTRTVALRGAFFLDKSGTRAEFLEATRDLHAAA